MTCSASRLLVRGAVLAVALFGLGGCVTPDWANLSYWQKRKQPRMTTVAPNGTPVHASWCYETLAEIDCYDRPQDVPPGRLVSVDPPQMTPLTREQYDKALADSR